MLTLVMRHGIAVSGIYVDSERFLTVQGFNESSLISCWISKKITSKIDRVLISPYLRARQTLIAMRKYLAFPDSYEILQSLTPSGNIKIVECYLWKLAHEGVNLIMIITHLPIISHIIYNLCAEKQSSLIFANSSVMGIDLDVNYGKGKLLWQIDPSQILTST